MSTERARGVERERGAAAAQRAPDAERARARHLYYRARLQRLLGRGARAAELCRRALDQADYTRAYELLSNMELPGEHYLRVLARVHALVRPATYVEIGVAAGKSLALLGAHTDAIGIDPAPRLPHAPGPRQRLFAETSDEFFARHDLKAELAGRALTMAFIDGMHHFEFALRDFLNLERFCAPGSLIFVHDCYPIDERSAAREQSTAFWSGDVWRLIVLLKRHRPDLSIQTLGVPPTGLGLITRLDPESQLAQSLPALIEEGLALPYESIAARKADALNLMPYDWGQVRALVQAAHT